MTSLAIFAATNSSSPSRYLVPLLVARASQSGMYCHVYPYTVGDLDGGSNALDSSPGTYASTQNYDAYLVVGPDICLDHYPLANLPMLPVERTVIIGGPVSGYDSITTDYEEAIEAALDHLFEVHGVKSPSLWPAIDGPAPKSRFEEIFSNHCIETAQGPVDGWIVTSPGSLESLHGRLLQTHHDFTVPIVAMGGAQGEGLRRYSSIDVPWGIMADRAISTLIQRIEEPRAGGTQLVFPAKFSIGSDCSCVLKRSRRKSEGETPWNLEEVFSGPLHLAEDFLHWVEFQLRIEIFRPYGLEYDSTSIDQLSQGIIALVQSHGAGDGLPPEAVVIDVYHSVDKLIFMGVHPGTMEHCLYRILSVKEQLWTWLWDAPVFSDPWLRLEVTGFALRPCFDRGESFFSTIATAVSQSVYHGDVSPFLIALGQVGLESAILWTMENGESRVLWGSSLVGQGMSQGIVGHCTNRIVLSIGTDSMPLFLSGSLDDLGLDRWAHVRQYGAILARAGVFSLGPIAGAASAPNQLELALSPRENWTIDGLSGWNTRGYLLSQFQSSMKPSEDLTVMYLGFSDELVQKLRTRLPDHFFRNAFNHARSCLRDRDWAVQWDSGSYICIVRGLSLDSSRLKAICLRIVQTFSVEFSGLLPEARQLIRLVSLAAPSLKSNEIVGHMVSLVEFLSKVWEDSDGQEVVIIDAPRVRSLDTLFTRGATLECVVGDGVKLALV